MKIDPEAVRAVLLSAIQNVVPVTDSGHTHFRLNWLNAAIQIASQEMARHLPDVATVSSVGAIDNTMAGSTAANVNGNVSVNALNK